MSRLLMVIAGGLAATACATATPTVGDVMREDAAAYADLAKEWQDAADLEERGVRLLESGERKINRGNDRIEDGRRDVRRGEALVRDGEDEVARGTRLREQGRLMREAAEQAYQRESVLADAS